MKDEISIFISYAREDVEIATRLYNDIRNAKVEPWLDQVHELRPWLDQIELKPGDHWRERIVQAIRECRYFIALISSNSLSKRGFVHKELRVALDILDEFPKDKIYLVPVRIDNCIPVDEKLQHIQWVDLFPSYQSGFKKILSAISPQLKMKYSKGTIPQFDGNFTSLKGIVTDSRTGLMWAARDNGEEITFENAREYCRNYQGGGYKDWRLPTIKELQGLYDSNLVGYFPECTSTYKVYLTKLIHLTCIFVWSSETDINNTVNYFDFHYGHRELTLQSDTNGYRALPVRVASP